ncbi:hypothetical protein SeMB42_g03312 [Synchytrium endobioticum]|uniref:Uncharacterized protein n=1 Tax=Synchytrium endobioticum TaxID=286115 RepID=A0A507D7P4_9FUNG|nr:hypothetical protein SeMB42_g03312 [Synchytrium endobioticum]
MLWLRTVVVILLMPIQIHLALAVSDETYSQYTSKLSAKYEDLIREFKRTNQGYCLDAAVPKVESHRDLDSWVGLILIQQCMSRDFPFGLAELTQAPNESMTKAELIFKWQAHRLLRMKAKGIYLPYGVTSLSRKQKAALPSLIRAHSSLAKAYEAIIFPPIMEKTIGLEPGFRTSKEGKTKLLDALDQEDCASVSKALASEITRMIKAVEDIKEDEKFSPPIENLDQAHVMTSTEYIEFIVKTSIPMPLPYVDSFRDLSIHFWKRPPSWMGIERLVIIRQIHALAYQKLEYSILLLTAYLRDLKSKGLSTESLELSHLESAREVHFNLRAAYQKALGQAWKDVNSIELQKYNELLESAYRNFLEYGMRSEEVVEQFLALHNVLSPVYPYMLAQVKGLPFWVPVALRTKTGKDTPPELLLFGLKYYYFVYYRAKYISQLFNHAATLPLFLEEALTKLNHYRHHLPFAVVDAHLVPQLEELRITSSNTDDRHASRTSTHFDRPSSSSGQSSSGGYIGN